jgi:hypothetical protein
MFMNEYILFERPEDEAIYRLNWVAAQTAWWETIMAADRTAIASGFKAKCLDTLDRIRSKE